MKRLPLDNIRWYNHGTITMAVVTGPDQTEWKEPTARLQAALRHVEAIDATIGSTLVNGPRTVDAVLDEQDQVIALVYATEPYVPGVLLPVTASAAMASMAPMAPMPTLDDLDRVTRELVKARSASMADDQRIAVTEINVIRARNGLAPLEDPVSA